MNLTPGKHYFIRQTRRTDSFRHKRYTTPALVKDESMIVMGELLEKRETEIKLKLVGNNFERDGDEYVFSEGRLLVADDGLARTLEEHGKPNAVLGKWT